MVRGVVEDDDGLESGAGESIVIQWQKRVVSFCDTEERLGLGCVSDG